MRSTHTPPAPTPWGRIVGIGVILSIVVSLLVLAFAWPSVTSSVKSLPIAVTGPDAAITQVEAAFEKNAPDTFEFVTATDRDDAVNMIKTRAAEGGIVLGEAPEVLTASAGSTIVSGILTGVAPKLQAQINAAMQAQGVVLPQPITVTVTDVVPLADTDVRGAGLIAAAFPLTLGGVLGGILASVLIVGAWRRVVAISVYVVVGGLALAGVLQGWFGILQGNYLVNAAAIGLTLMAISATIVGIVSLVGKAGLAVGPVVFMVLANPISSATQPLEFLPEPWGAIGQLFPPGAGATLLRDLSYFPDAPTLFPWLVLAAWSAFGVILAVIGHFRGAMHIEIDSESDSEIENHATREREPAPVG